MEEKVVKKINHDISEITERITEKLSKRDYLESVLRRLNFHRRCWEHRWRVEYKEAILRNLYTALDELNFMSNKAANGELFVEKLDKISLNYLKLHGSKNMAEEKKIIRDIKIQQKEKDDASFKSLQMLKEMALGFCRVKHIEQITQQNNYMNGWLKLGKEIEQFQIQLMERAFKENISIYESLKKTIKDQIKFLCDYMESGRVKYRVKELDAINGEIHSLRAKLTEKYNKKDEAYQRILKLKCFCIM